MVEIVEGTKFNNPHFFGHSWVVIHDSGLTATLYNKRTDLRESFRKSTIRSYLESGRWVVSQTEELTR